MEYCQPVEITFELGRIIKAVRKAEGHETYSSFSRATGLNRSYLHQVESGKKNITIENLYIIARGLNVKVATLLPEEPWLKKKSIKPSGFVPDWIPIVKREEDIE